MAAPRIKGWRSSDVEGDFEVVVDISVSLCSSSRFFGAILFPAIREFLICSLGSSWRKVANPSRCRNATFSSATPPLQSEHA